MRNFRRHRDRAAIVAALASCLLAGCVTQMTEKELGACLDRAVPSRRAIRRIVPVYAQTRMEAFIRLTGARTEPESSELSVELAAGFKLGQRTQIDYVVGGPYPDLLEQLVLNALMMNEGRALSGLRIVLVSPAPPTPELRQAVKASRARLEYRSLDQLASGTRRPSG